MKSVIYVGRKLLWQDSVDARKRSKWFKPENALKVNFIGEPAVDGGGPRREFFCGTVFKIFNKFTIKELHYVLYALSLPRCLGKGLFIINSKWGSW